MLKQVNIDIQDALIFLPGVKLFIKLDNRIISDIAKRMSMHRYAAGEHLIRQGQPGEYMLIIKQGKVKVNLEDKDIELSKGSVISEIALLSGKRSKADLLAKRDMDRPWLHTKMTDAMARHTELLLKEIHRF